MADLAMSCSCPDREVPCKHLSATFYLLAESFDEDPFRILHWRGRERTALLGRLRELRGDPAGAVSVAGPAEEPLSGQRRVGAATALADRVSPDRVSPDRVSPDRASEPVGFWLASELPPRPAQPELPPDLVLRQLPLPGPTLGGAVLLAALRPLYARLAGSEGQRET